MHLSPLQILTILTLVLMVSALIWVAFVVFRKKENTRERFAFAALAAISSMVASVLAAMGDKQTVLGEIFAALRDVRGQHGEPPQPHIADHVLMIVVVLLVIYFVLRIYDNWNGAVSVRQYDKARYHEPAPLLAEGLYEAKRILKREPPIQIFNRGDRSGLQNALEPPQYSPAWHVEARDLICLGNPTIELDINAGWHPQMRCWIGVNRKTRGIIAVRCSDTELGIEELRPFITYVVKLEKQSHVIPTEYILATRYQSVQKSIQVDGISVTVYDQETLLQGLVDFSDYFADLIYRVERQTLPDSAQVLADVYVAPKCREETDARVLNLEDYVFSWSVEPGQRQLALLGEYGQGKSTAALMFAYRVVQSSKPLLRVPVVIELRGRSPRNMTPEELIAAWAYPYRIDPQAVMKLLAAGRLLLILEGFDEMALVGDAEARLAHFQTLWKLCYPSAKILITGRPNFFLDDREMRAALGIFKTSAAGPYCEAIHLVPFDLHQIQTALRSSPPATRDEIVALAAKDSRFLEIVSRGSLLYVVSQRGSAND